MRLAHAPSPPFSTSAVRDVYAGFGDQARAALLAIRSEVFDLAAADPRIGRLQETLKWGQPSYLTPETKSGTTLRLWTPKTGGYAIYVHCQSRLMHRFQSRMGAGLRFDGNRGVLFDLGTPPPLDLLRPLIHATLTYHLKKDR